MMIPTPVKYATGVTAFAVGFLACGGAGMLLGGVHVQPAPLPAVLMYVAGLELMALGYLVVRNLRGEVALRVGLYLVYGYVVVGSAFLGISGFAPSISALVGAAPVPSPQGAAWLVVAGVAFANLVLLYRRYGAGWHPRGAQSSRPRETASPSA